VQASHLAMPTAAPSDAAAATVNKAALT
jgi:hypothetical protein